MRAVNTAYIVDIGRTRYQKAWDFQLKLWQMRVTEKIPNTLILVEHDHVITRGRSARDENLLYGENELKKRGVDLHSVERGGDFTYHGPGQLVGYPIFHIKKGLAGIRPLVQKVEESIVRTVGEFGIESKGSMDSGRGASGAPVGVWVGDKKLAAIGIAVKKWVSFHGFALNISTDLDMFSMIVPCGLENKGVTSMEKLLDERPSFEQVKSSISRAFGDVFEINFKVKRMENFADE